MAREWYERAGATFVTLVDPTHQVSSLFGLVNVPSAVWIDEAGLVRRIDEGAYAAVHRMGTFEFGRADYAPLVEQWVETGAHVRPVGEFADSLAPRSSDAARAEPAFKLGVYFHRLGDTARAERYWAMAQSLNPDSWNYHRQDWSFTPEKAGPNWQRKFDALGDKPYYRPIDGLDEGQQ